MENEGLPAHWPLTGDCRDHSGKGLHGINHGVELTYEGAQFDGRSAYIEVPDHPALRFGKGDFSITAWIHTEENLDDTLGDVIAKYDPGRRNGFNLCIQNFHGVASAQPNYRNLLFGIDDGKLDPAWTNCGRPGNNLMVWALCVYDGRLYAGTFEAGKDQAGHIYRYEGAAAWTDCGSPYPSNAITALAIYDGALYAGASHYRAAGSALADSENTFPGGFVFRYEGGTTWTNCGKAIEGESVGGLVVYKGALYASSMYAPGGLYRYEGGTAWAACGNPEGRVEALTVYDGHIYASGWDAGRSGVYRYEGGKNWTDCGTPPETTQTYSFAEHYGKLYVGTWPTGKVFRYGGSQTWEDCGRLGEEQEVMGMAVYNAKLYAGTLPLAEVCRYDGDGHWTRTGRLDTTPDVKYRRAWSMAVYQGKLFCGTLPSGHVYSIEAGKCVTHDHVLSPGWQHIAAVKRGGALHLYINGQQAAESATFDTSAFDLNNDKSLTIGFGAHAHFNGKMKAMRLYDQALDRESVKRLSTASPE